MFKPNFLYFDLCLWPAILPLDTAGYAVRRCHESNWVTSAILGRNV